jgi:hypothetical protein
MDDNIYVSVNGENWNTINKNDYRLRAVTYGNGLYITVGDNGVILMSSDAQLWIPAPTPGTTNTLWAISYGNDKFVAIGDHVIITSSDGETWTPTLISDKLFYGVTYGNGTFVAVGDAIATSSDGIQWDIQTGFSGLNSVIYGNGTFVAVGNNGKIIQSIPFKTKTDFNGDAKPDLLWQHPYNGNLYIWLMDGVSTLSYNAINTEESLNWKVVDTEDFNKDGQTDIAWQNQVTGDISIWLMDGMDVMEYQAGGGVQDPYWRLVSIDDFNGDGHPDYLWQHQTSGDLYTWFLQWDSWWEKVVVMGGESAGGISDPKWKIAGTDDFNGDGYIDYLWQHEDRGDIYMVLDTQK